MLFLLTTYLYSIQYANIIPIMPSHMVLLINCQWLKLSIFRTFFYGFQGGRAETPLLLLILFVIFQHNVVSLVFKVAILFIFSAKKKVVDQLFAKLTLVK